MSTRRIMGIKMMHPLRMVTHACLFLLVLGWTIPTAGLLISSLRDKDQLIVSGWWTALSASQGAERGRTGTRRRPGRAGRRIRHLRLVLRRRQPEIGRQLRHRAKGPDGVPGRRDRKPERRHPVYPERGRHL